MDEFGNEMELVEEKEAGVSASGAYDIDTYNDAAYKNWDENVLEKCPNCGRTFRPEALIIHLKSCKADKPLKKPL